MDEPVLTMDSNRLRAEPGGQAQVSVKVRNPGQLVESFKLDVVGLDAEWWQVHPPELGVYPGKEESAVVVLSPPAQAEAPEHALPFGVRVVSTLDNARSVVEEGDLEIGRVQDLQAAITPVTSRGRWSGKHDITYTNWGNSPAHLRLSISDKDEALGFQLVPEQLTVPVGGTASAHLRVRPRNPFLRGQPAHRPFQVVGEVAGAGPVPGTPRSAAARAGVPDPGRPVLDGAIQHLPILSKAVIVLAALLLAAIVGVVLLLLQIGSVPGARQPDAAPEAPAGFVADSVAADLIQLRWDAVDRAATYRVQRVDEAGAAVLQVTEVPGGATALDAKVEQPSTRMCYQVVAVRGQLTGPPSERQCATSRNGQLPAPTDVKAVPAPTGFAVSWTDNPLNDHVILVDGSPTVQPPAGISNATVPVPAGRHCIQVLAKRGQSLSSPPSSEVCVESAGTPPPAGGGAAGGGAAGGGAAGGGAAGGGAAGGSAAGGGAAGGGAAGGGAAGGGAAGGGGTPGTGGGGALSGWVAVVGPPYQEQSLADSTLRQVQAAGVTAQIVPVTALPRLGYKFGMFVVITGFTTRDQALQVCNTLPPDTPKPCDPQQAG